MALSKIHKNFLSTLSSNPNEVALQLINNNDFLNSFDKQFLNDGTSLTHVLIDGYIYQYPKYKQITLDILENTHLNLFQKKDSKKKSAYDIFIETNADKIKNFNSFPLEEQDQFSLQYFELIQANNLKTPIYYYVLALEFFLIHDYDDYYKKLFTIPLPIYNYSSTSLTQNIILKNNISYLTQIFEKFPTTKLEITSTYFLDKNYKNEKSNLLIFSIRNNSHNISNYFLENFNFLLSGKVSTHSEYSYNIYRTNNPNNPIIFTHAVLEAINQNNFELFVKLLTKMNKNDLIQSLNSSNNYNNTIVLDKILTHSDIRYINTLHEHLPIIKDMNNQTKIEFMKNLIESPSQFSEIRSILELFEPEKTFLDAYNANRILNYFWQNINGRDIINDQDIIDIVAIYNIFKKNDLEFWNPDFLFNLKLLERPLLLEALLNNGLNINIYPDIHSNQSLNLLCTLTQNKNTTYLLEHDKYQKSLSLIYQHSLGLNIKDNYYSKLLRFSLKNESKSIYNLITKQNIIDYDMNNGMLFNELKSCSKSFLEYVYPTLLELNNHPFNELDTFIPFYLFLKYNIEPIIMNNLFLNHNPNNITLYQLSENQHFWDYIYHDETWTYIKDNGANFNSDNITNFIINSKNQYLIKKYFEFGGKTPQIQEVQALIQTNQYAPTSVLIELFPYFASIMNQQQKYLISYLIPKLHKQIVQDLKSNIVPRRDSLYNLIIQLIRTGMLHKEPKALKHIKDQLTKYELITSTFPELSQTLHYELLNSQLNNKPPIIKKHKI
jgi:hypothetical protein